MKRILASLGAVAMVMVSAGPAFGAVIGNTAQVNTMTITAANSGGNTQRARSTNLQAGLLVGGGNGAQTNLMGTGGAQATTVVTTEANNDCDDGLVLFNDAEVNTLTATVANSGLNRQSTRSRNGQIGVVVAGGAPVQTNAMTTGNAVAATDVWTVVNSSYMTSTP